MSRKILPEIKAGNKLWLIVIDNFRLDQWITVSAMLGDLFSIDSALYCTLLPTESSSHRR